MLNNYQIVTITRTGSHYLQELIEHYLGHKLIRGHEIVQTPIISLVRDPLETVASAICWASYEFGALSLNPNFYKIVWHYETLGKQLFDHNSVILIKYSDLINKPEKVMEYLSNYFNIELNNAQYKSKLKDEGNGHILRSSIKDFYPVAYKYAELMDLTKLYEIYNQLNSKTIKIN